jgi:hypothetical protein
MKLFVRILIFSGLFLHALTAVAGPVAPSDEVVVQEASQALSDILDLWRNEQFGQLYLHTNKRENHDEYFFLGKMVNSLRKPACCWEKLRDVKAAYVSRDRVILIATIGLEMDGVGPQYVTQSFSLSRENGIWKIPMQTILTLAETSGYRAVPRDIIEKPLP